MEKSHLVSKAHSYLHFLCGVQPNRRTGSAGNREAVDYVASSFQSLGYKIDTSRFEVLDHVNGGSSLIAGRDRLKVFTSPYSNGCDISAELAVVESVEQLEITECKGKLLLLRGEICDEQLMPKNFVFYNPEHHQKIFSLLEMKAPAAIITATKQKPDQVGALDPFPLIVDGDFNIPSVFCRDEEGRCLLNHLGKTVDLKIYANRIKSYSSNVIAQLGVEAAKKVILTAHIDAYENSPGASDNASGTVVLLILGELLSSYKGTVQIEIAVLNGEDHYSAAGQMDYLHRYGNEISRCFFAINIDDVGYMKGGTSFSFYHCSKAFTEQAQAIFYDFEEIVQGPQWFNGDHMIFVQNEVPCIAFTSENMPELMKAITHTEKDTPEMVDPVKLVNIADAISRLVWDIS